MARDVAAALDASAKPESKPMSDSTARETQQEADFLTAGVMSLLVFLE